MLQTEVRSSKAQDMSDDEENFDEDGDYEVEDIELSAEDQQALQVSLLSLFSASVLPLLRP